MTITLALTPEQEIKLRESASRNEREKVRSILREAVDASLDEVCARGVEPRVPESPSEAEALDPEAVQRHLSELARLGRGLGPLSPEAFSRENLYREDW